jgi:hypothetical protein
MTKRKTTKAPGGRPSLFPGKRRGRTISLTMTDAHLDALDAATERLQVTRSDLLALLVDRYADIVEIPPTLAGRLPERRD